ncbi:hypothetical protein [Candidatus Odyssella thessalonicensis]|uniref:hypothetical protein n=1 Tax=Candidatus Odyssella thessalonicensis TaxID=84647 RepID=UPI000225B4BD|nr:hypothetical protein [Candidatus Odyssella thessalonicensis]
MRRKSPLFLMLLVILFTSLLHASDRRSSKRDDYFEYDESKGLYFIMERVTPSNFKFWQLYRNAMLRIASNVGLETEHRIDYAQALKGFQNSLNAYQENGAQVWIAYATRNPKATGFMKMARIEICVTVITSPGLPIVTHMGIFRSPLSLLSDEAHDIANEAGVFREHNVNDIIAAYRKVVPPSPKYKGLALLLHSFAARGMLELDKTKTLMVTAPLKVMSDMLVRSPLGREVIHIDQAEVVVTQPQAMLGSHVISPEVAVTDLKRDNKTVIRLPMDALKVAPWLGTVTFLTGTQPKIAIPLPALATPTDAE